MIRMMRILRAALVSLAFAALLIWLTLLHIQARQVPDQTDSIRILFPSNGTVLSSQSDTEVTAELAPRFQDPQNFTAIQFTVTTLHGIGVFNLGRGDLRSFKTFDQARAFWRTRAMPSGEYIIIATLEDLFGNVFEDRVQITLNRAPAARIVALATEVVPGGAQVTLQPDVQDVEGDPIVRALWTPGDDTESIEFNDLRPFTHTYAGIPGDAVTYVVTLTADDARGGRVAVQRDVIVDQTSATTIVDVRQTHDCGCREMAIFARAAIGQTRSTYCAPGTTEEELKKRFPTAMAVQNPKGEEACPEGSLPFKVLLGPSAPGTALGWAFEVSAELDPRTNDPSRCTEGQAARGDRVVDGRTITNPSPASRPPAGPNLPFEPPRPDGKLIGAGGRYPNFGEPDWGSDDYASPNDIGAKVHLPGIKRIRWLDHPQVQRTKLDGSLASTLTERLRFVSWVQGTGGDFGSCYCEFEYQHSWDVNDVGKPGTPDGRTGPNTLTLISGQRCSIR